MPALAAVLTGVLLGFGSGGNLSELRHLKLRWEWVILPLFAIQAISRGRILGVVGASQWSLAVWVAASAALAVAMLRNWKLPGMALGAMGILMNLDVVLLNRAMPVVLGEESGLQSATAGIALNTGGFYRLSAEGDLVAWLGDAMPIALGPTALLVSPGDIVLMVAVVAVIVHGMGLSNGANGGSQGAG